MADDAWHVGSSAGIHRPSQETRPANETRLLHELIVQAVTERRIDVDPDRKYEDQLHAAMTDVQATDGYKSLLSRGSFRQSDVSALLDHQHLQRLPTVDSAHHVTMMMATGGPATGKSSIIGAIRQAYPETFRNAARVNPDDYKPLLADRAIYGADLADVTHAESSHLAADIMVRLEQKMAAGRAPNIVMDVVATSEHRMNFAQQAGQLIVVTGVVPIDVAVDRSYVRGQEPDGRRVSTEVVISGARNVAIDLPRVFEHADVKFAVVDTDVAYGTPAKPVAQLVTTGNMHTLVVANPDTFINLVERQNLNIHAHSPAELYRPQDRTPEAIAQGLKAYTDRGVTLAFLDTHGQIAMTIARDGVTQAHPLASQRGAAFFAGLAAAVRSSIALDETHRAPDTPDGHGRTATTDAEPMMAARAGVIGAGVGAAMGIRGTVDDLAGRDSRLRHDWHAGGAQAVVGSARFATQASDAIIATTAAVEGTHRAVTRSAPTIAGAARAAGEAGPAMRLAGRVAIPLAVAAGALEATAGVAEHHPVRVAAAVGNTGGGVAGGVLGGMLAGSALGFVTGGTAGSESGPGAVITAGIGALGGAIWGGMIGEREAKRHLSGAIDEAMHLFGVGSHDQPHPAPVAQHPAQAAPQPTHYQPPISHAPGADLSPDMQRALQAAFGSNLSGSILCNRQHRPPAFHPPALPPRTSGAGVCR